MEPNTNINEENANKFKIFCRIEEEEHKAITWYNRSLGFRSIIKTTEWIAKNQKNDARPIQDHYQPNNLQRFLIIVFTSFWSIMMVFAIIELRKNQSYSFLYLLIAFAFVAILIIRQLVNKKVNYHILLSTQNIKIQEKYYPWPSILETYIVKRPGGRGGTYFLIIGFTKGKLLRYNINNLRSLFSNSVENKLAKAIEHYKAQAKKSTPLPSPASTISTPHTP